jgi:hypothetical protein
MKQQLTHSTATFRVWCGGTGIYLPTVTMNIFSPPHPATAEYHTQSHRQPVRGKDDREVNLQIQY